MNNHYDRGHSGQSDTSRTQREREAYNLGQQHGQQTERHFQELGKWQKPKGARITSDEVSSALPFLLAAAAFFYVWSYFDNLFLGAIGAAVAWRFAESRLGQGLLRMLLLVVGLGVAWFFIELSKTFR